MKVYNGKKEFVGYVSRQDGVLRLQKDDDSSGLSAWTGARKDYFGVMFRDLFLWFAFAELLTVVGYFVNEKWGSYKSEYIWLKLVSSDNLFLASPFAYFIQMLAAFVTCLAVRKIRWLFGLFCLRTVFVIGMAVGILPYNFIILTVELLIIVLIPFVIRHCFMEYLQHDISKIADKLPGTYQYNVLIPGIAFLISMALMFYGLIPFATMWNAEPADFFYYIGNLQNNSGDITLGTSLCMLRVVEVYMYLAAAVVVIRIMKERKTAE